MVLTLWIAKHLQFFVKNPLFSFLLSCSSNSSRPSFVICLTLVLAWFPISSALSFQYFCTSSNTLSNSPSEMFSSCVACEMILAMLPCFEQAA